ncbi:hypothetical protein Tco_1081909 [Tanacetum coccineum]|uniref:Uncharacterized protein n=1 Tax=Tanacetum coccineum TaxID=301880 RepID=A0ABQ5HZS6_9ASTR
METYSSPSTIPHERLLEHIICQDVVNIVMHADVKFDNLLPVQNTFLDDNIALDVLKMENDRLIELLEYNENLDLKAQLSKRNNMIEQDVFIELSKRYSQLEKHCISLELAMQQRNEKQARTSNPLDNALAYACMFTKQIQEVYVSDTCPSSPSRSEKLVAVTPMNKARKVTFAKTSTTSENNTQKRVDLHKTQTTNKPLVPSISVKSSTNASISIPRSNTKTLFSLFSSSSVVVVRRDYVLLYYFGD